MTDVLVSRTGAVVELRLDRASKKNALTPSMYGTLAAGLRDARADATVRAALLTASGETFCAGNDIGDFLSRDAGGAVAPAAFIQALVDFDKPLVAAVQGPAVGIGATMLLHCDLVYASTTTRLRMPFVSLGLVPEAGVELFAPPSRGRGRRGRESSSSAPGSTPRERRSCAWSTPCFRRRTSSPRSPAREPKSSRRAPRRLANDACAVSGRPWRPARPHCGRGTRLCRASHVARSKGGAHGLPRAPCPRLLESL